MEKFEAGPVTAPESDLGESPLWDHRSQILYWVDIFAGVVHEMDNDGSCRSTKVASLVTFVGLDESGGLVAAIGHDLVETHGTAMSTLGKLGSNDPSMRSNDGNVDSGGRLWIGTMAYDAGPGRGALYRVGHEGEATTALTGVTISNGIDWSPDGAIMYYIDTPTRTVARLHYDVESKVLEPSGPPIDVSDAEGVPDGMCVDSEGFLWIAFWGGSQVRRYAPGGPFVDSINLPVSLVTACAFGGPDLSTLYITTAKHGLTKTDLDGEPLAGRLFASNVGTRGRPMHQYRH